jgi:hypothetical protein
MVSMKEIDCDKGYLGIGCRCIAVDAVRKRVSQIFRFLGKGNLFLGRSSVGQQGFRRAIFLSLFFLGLGYSAFGQSPTGGDQSFTGGQAGSQGAVAGSGGLPAADIPAGTTSGSGLPSASRLSPQGLPNGQGQVWREYDLRNYTSMMRDKDRPHQGVIDWVLRETGTDVWFTEPFGFMNADRDTLRVYHTPEMQKVVQGVVERVVNGPKEKQVYEARLVLMTNPNWRSSAIAMPQLRSVQTRTPGISAWLLSKEQMALMAASLRNRADYRELRNVEMLMYNGQSEFIEQVRGRNYLRDYQRVEAGWPPFIPQTAELQEGYRMQISTLLSEDRETVDVVIRCEIDQVEKLSNVNLNLPMPGGQLQNAQIQVPQMSSWRLHERFKWPSDQVLVLSCGVVAAPSGSGNNTLLGQSGGIMSLLPGATAERADALLVIQHKGDASSHLTAVQANSGQANSGQANSGQANPGQANAAAVPGSGVPGGVLPGAAGVASPAGLTNPGVIPQQSQLPSVSRGRY